MLTRQELLLGASVRATKRPEMLSDVAVMCAPRAETMGVRSKMEPWSLHDDFSLVNESGSPLSTAISTSFWDQLLQNKVDSNTLFAMTASPADRGLQPSTPTFYSYARDTSQGSDSTGSSSHSDQQEERCKRRRMLQFNPGVNTGGFARDSPSSYERVIGSPTTTYSSYSSYSPSYESSPLSTVYSGDDYMLPPYDSSPGLTTSAWFPGSVLALVCFPIRHNNLLTTGRCCRLWRRADPTVFQHKRKLLCCRSTLTTSIFSESFMDYKLGNGHCYPCHCPTPPNNTYCHHCNTSNLHGKLSNRNKKLEHRKTLFRLSQSLPHLVGGALQNPPHPKPSHPNRLHCPSPC
ncbi:uncharacterized protein [Physcomitrium patens]|uniref:uncharacterized protein isoform X2 n=1 Tax=Physcomitrium patens TaxID=3218 RepID=UPI000D17E40E|nr:uncharacterized protein LOC112275686 isoform X2 [Physcomitrium patens]|eukprot:XP_024362039.1 uncharacterized protein LOC112275686 isoform X2 [Physcomitrella patens]